MTIKTSLRKKIRGVRRHGHTTHRGLDDHDLYATDSEVSTISGTLQTDIDANTALIGTTSGTLQAGIDAKPDTLLELTDTPVAYDDEKYLRSTASGTEWSTVSGISGADHSILGNLDYASAGHTGFQPTGDYATNTKVDTTSGTLQDQLDEIPAGADTEIQFNDNGTLAGDSDFAWDNSGKELTLYGDVLTDRWLNQDSNLFLGVDAAGEGSLSHSSGDEGYYNIGIGNKALYRIDDGEWNIGIGYQCLYNNLQGVNNLFIGHNSGYSTGDSHENVFVGNESGYNLWWGSHNVAIGFQALYSNQTGTGNVSIGYKAGYNETGSNKLYIDNTDTVNPLIYGEFDNDLVVINGNLLVTGSTVASGSESGNQVIVSGTTTQFVSFSDNQIDTDYRISTSIRNTVDVIPSIYSFMTNSATVSGFNVIFSGAIDSGNYSIDWSIVR